jgi:D-amino peptidase
MKLLIAVDMEGTSGLTTWDQVTPGHAEYQRFRKIMTADVNAAIRGAAEADVDEIVVTDGHWNGDNLLIEELDPRARLNTGSPSPFSMVEGVQQGVDAVFFVGYHARIGTENAILDHTWSSTRVMNLWINGRICGEVGLNASLCAHFNAPVILVTGDQAVGAEAREWLPGVETAQTKTAHGRWSAEVLPLVMAQENIYRGALQAVRRFRQGDFPALVKQPQLVKVRIEFFYADMADKAALLPGGKRLDGRMIEFVAPDMAGAYQSFRAAVTLAQR